MKTNYASIPSRRGGGIYGYLGGLVPDTVYGTISPGTAFLTPPDPGPLVIPTVSTNVIREISTNTTQKRAGSTKSG